jgi:primosomal protein N' (replication factor Y)
MIVVTPSVRRSRSAHGALRRQGVACALIDEDWDRCRSVTAIGQRSAVFAPLGDVRLVVVVDEHDERLTAEGSPTWNAREVAIERARRAGVPCVLISATPSVDAVHFGGLHRPPRGPERAGWPLIEVIDTAEIDPRERQFPAALIRSLRGADRVAVIAERLGQARIAVCTGCRMTANCERCGAALNRPEPGSFRCTRCDLERPVICAACGRTRFKNLLLGAQRIAEELPAALGEPVGLVTARHRGDLPAERVLVGTEALLHRLTRAEVVAFVDFDSMLLAPRYRAHERLLGSMAHAARLVGAASSAPRSPEPSPRGRLVVCTRNGGHPLVAALAARRPVDVIDSESQVRRTLRLPPFGSLARIGGPAGAAFIASIPEDAPVEVRAHREEWLVRAEDRARLLSALGPLDRPSGRLRLQVDPYDV